MGIRFKDSVIANGFNTHLVTLLRALARVSEDMNRNLTVTSISDSVHGPNSWHHHDTGSAIDIRTRDLTSGERQEVITRLREALGSAYTVLDEGDHLHAQPKKGTPRT